MFNLTQEVADVVIRWDLLMILCPSVLYVLKLLIALNFS